MSDRLDKWEGFLQVMRDPEALAKITHEIESATYGISPRTYHPPRYFYSLQPEKKEFITVDLEGYAVVYNYDSLEQIRTFKIAEPSHLFINDNKLYALYDRLIGNWRVNYFEYFLAVYDYQGNSKILEINIDFLLLKGVRFIVIEDQLFITQGVNFHHRTYLFKINYETSEADLIDEWENIEVLDTLKNTAYFLRNEHEIIRYLGSSEFGNVFSLKKIEEPTYVGRKDNLFIFSYYTPACEEACYCFDPIEPAIKYTIKTNLDEDDKLLNTTISFMNINNEIILSNRYSPILLDQNYISENNIIIVDRSEKLLWYNDGKIKEIEIKGSRFVKRYFDKRSVFLFYDHFIKKIDFMSDGLSHTTIQEFPERITIKDQDLLEYTIYKDYIIKIIQGECLSFISNSSNVISTIPHSHNSNLISPLSQFQTHITILGSLEYNYFVYLGSTSFNFNNNHKGNIFEWDSTNNKIIKYDLHSQISDALPIHTVKLICSKGFELDYILLGIYYANKESQRDIYKWEFNSKLLSKYYVETSKWTDLEISDYNKSYILFTKNNNQNIETKVYLIRILSLSDKLLYNIEISPRLLRDHYKIFLGDVCLCSDTTISYINLDDFTIVFLDFLTQESKSIKFERLLHTYPCLRYNSETDIIQLSQGDVVLFFKVMDLRLLAKLTVFEDNTFIYLSYVDNYFYSNRPKKALNIINKFHDKPITSSEMARYIKKYNWWKHFDELLFLGKNYYSIPKHGLPKKYPPKMLND